MNNIPYDEHGHKCINCGKWLCETPDELECPECKEKRLKEGIIGDIIRSMGSMLLITKCPNCEGLMSKEYTPKGSSV